MPHNNHYRQFFNQEPISYDEPPPHSTRRSKLFSVFVTLMLAFLIVSVSFIHSNMQSSAETSNMQVNSLIEEIGFLNEQNFMLNEEVQSQRTVLKSIEGDFTDLELNYDLEGSELAQNFKKGFDADFELPSYVSEDSTFDILVIGNNGAHSDTIMVASVNQEERRITMISIPRDLYINGRRINEYYYYYGIDQMQRMVEMVTGLKLDKYVQVDFEGFTAMVDMLGGLEVNVDTSIYDGMYPNGRGGYEAFSITAGQHHMDGEQALKYARSRKSTTDFDRAARQQKILSAAKLKAMQLDTVMDMKELTQLFKLGVQYTDTNLNVIDLISYYYDFKDYEVQTGFVLSTQNHLHSMINISGAYILLPKSGNFDHIHQVISELVN
jgi:LCP family protein required for cell wall assembly